MKLPEANVTPGERCYSRAMRYRGKGRGVRAFFSFLFSGLRMGVIGESRCRDKKQKEQCILVLTFCITEHQLNLEPKPKGTQKTLNTRWYGGGEKLRIFDCGCVSFGICDLGRVLFGSRVVAHFFVLIR